VFISFRIARVKPTNSMSSESVIGLHGSEIDQSLAGQVHNPPIGKKSDHLSVMISPVNRGSERMTSSDAIYSFDASDSIDGERVLNIYFYSLFLFFNEDKVILTYLNPLLSLR